MAMKKRSRVISLLLLIAAIAAVVIVISIFRTEGQNDRMTFTGDVEATEVEVSSKVSGRIEWLCCAVGAPVKALAQAVRIESSDMKSRVAEAQAALVSAGKLVDEAKIGVDNAMMQKEIAEYEAKAAYSETLRAAAVHNDAKNNLARAKELFDKGYMSKKDIDAAETLYATTAASHRSALARKSSVDMAVKNALVNIKGAQARLETAKARVALGEAQLKVVQTSLEETEMKFPFDGVVAYKSFEAGENVGPGASIYTIHDLNNLRVRFDVEESVVHKIRLNDSVTIELPSNSATVYSGKVVEISAVAGFATQRDVTRGRSDIKTFRIKAVVTNPEGVLKPGMTVKATIFFNNSHSNIPAANDPAKKPVKAADAPNPAPESKAQDKPKLAQEPKAQDKLNADQNSEKPRPPGSAPFAGKPDNAKTQ